jgi:hypothetical protein
MLFKIFFYFNASNINLLAKDVLVDIIGKIFTC